MTAEEYKEIVRRAQFDVFTGEENIEVLDELLSDDYVFHDPFLGEIDAEEFRNLTEQMRAGVSDLEVSIDEMIVEGDVVASRSSMGGRQDGPLPGIPEATGNEFDVSGMGFDRVEDGQLVESWWIGDWISLFEQLDVVEPETVPTA